MFNKKKEEKVKEFDAKDEIRRLQNRLDLLLLRIENLRESIPVVWRKYERTFADGGRDLGWCLESDFHSLELGEVTVEDENSVSNQTVVKITRLGTEWRLPC